jgi:hypothetical protein
VLLHLVIIVIMAKHPTQIQHMIFNNWGGQDIFLFGLISLTVIFYFVVGTIDPGILIKSS